jgi:hypothetical protein
LAVLPTDTTDLATEYTTPEEGDVFKNDDVIVGLTGSNFLVHQFKKKNDNNKDTIKVKIDLKSSLAPTSSTIFLQVWDGQQWVTLHSNNTAAADTDLGLYYTINTNQGLYYDFSNVITFRVYQEVTSGSETLSIDLVEILFKADYDDLYSAKSTSYLPKYTTKNPQEND